MTDTPTESVERTNGAADDLVPAGRRNDGSERISRPATRASTAHTSTEIEERLARLGARRAPRAASAARTATPADTPAATPAPEPRDAPATPRPEAKPQRPVRSVRSVRSVRTTMLRIARLFGAIALSVALLGGAGVYAHHAYIGAAEPAPADPRGMIVIPGARYTVGAASASTDELTARSVVLAQYAIDAAPVSADDYQRFLAAHAEVAAPTSWGARVAPIHLANLAVSGVAYRGAVAYCRAVGKRLPTEFEWEAAARGYGTQRFPWGDAARVLPHTDLPAPFDTGPFGVRAAVTGPAQWVGAPAIPTASGMAIARGGRHAGVASTVSRRAVVAIDDPTGAGVRCAADRVADTYAADLHSPQSGWPTTRDGRVSIGFAPPAGYAVGVYAPGTTAGVPMHLDVADGFVEAHMQLDRTTARGSLEYGITFRSGARGSFAFVLAPSTSEWRLLHVSGPHIRVVAHGRPAAFGGSAAPDTLRVVMHGARLDLFVDAQMVTRVTDRTFDRGDVGLWMHTATSRAARVVVDRFTASSGSPWQ